MLKKKSLQITHVGWEFPGGPVVRAPCFHCEGPGSIPGQGTKILQAARCGQKKKKSTHVGEYVEKGEPLYTVGGKTLIQKDICTPVFIEAQFTIASTWKQPKCPLTDDWIKEIWHTHTHTHTHTHNGILLSHKTE